MSKLRSLETSFWSDPFIEELSSEEKLLFIYLITNDKTNMLGIYEVSLKKMSFDTGIEKQIIINTLERFGTLGKVRYIDNFVILVNFLKHQKFNPNMMKSAIDVYNSLPNNLKSNKISVSKVNPSKGFQTLLNHYGMVPKVEVEDEVEREDKYKCENAYTFLKINSPEELQTFEMQNKKSIPDYKLFTEYFNNKVNIEELKYKPGILMARLKNLKNSWNQNTQKQTQNGYNPSDHIPSG